MSLGKQLGFALVLAPALFSFACSSGGSTSTNTIQTAEQDLTLDPDGTTTVVVFASASGLDAATTASFEGDAGQTATSIDVQGDTVTITWDARVTPNDEVRAVGLASVAEDFHAVTTSDGSAPTFTITNGTQNPGLGGDTFTVQFAGPRVVEATAEDVTSWTLKIGTTTLDLTGSTFDFDANTQSMDVTLGTNANLHSDFSFTADGVLSVADVAVDATAVDGTAAGDSSAPSLVSAEQNLVEDEFGRVVDFTFDEAMDPVFSTQLAHFVASSPDVATSIEQPSEDVLRVTFNGPIVPGVDTVDLTGLVDLHGNAFADVLGQAIAQPSPVANAIDTATAVTVPNSNNDYVALTTTQAFEPTIAEDPASWSLDIDGNPIDLTTQTLTYDLATKTLTIQLDFDLSNGDAFVLTGNAVLEVDGETYSDVANGTIAGDNAPPAVTSVTQNRTFDETGKTIDVLMNEDVEETTAENVAHWSASGGQNVVSATLLSGGNTVRVAFDAPVIPGDHTVGASAIKDVAGNTMAAPQVGLVVHPDDFADPVPQTATASAVEGSDDDTLSVTFDDDMIESEVETAANWHVETPIGSAVSTVGTTIDYVAGTRTATLTFANGINLRRGGDFAVHFTTARDLSGNTVDTTELFGSITSESTLPEVVNVYRSSNAGHAIVHFSEPCGALDDLYDATTNTDGTRYVLRTSGGVQRGLATAATEIDGGLGVDVAFGIVIDPTDTIDLIGVEDLAGNPCFPVLAHATEAEVATTPSLSLGASAFTSVSGGANDEITVVFDQAMSPWHLFDASNYTITQGATTLDLSAATFTFDGNATVTIRLSDGTGNDLQTGAAYDLSVNDVWSAQGVQRTIADAEMGIVCAGDAAGPTVTLTGVRIDPSDPNGLIVEVSESIDVTSAETAANYDYDFGNVPTSATRIGPRSIRLAFAVPMTPGNDLTFSVVDLAGNGSGAVSRLVTAADSTGPLVSNVAGTIRPGFGGDAVSIVFNEPVANASAVDPANYTVASGATTLSLVGASFSYDGDTNTVSIVLASGQELTSGAGITVGVANVTDVAGNAMAAPISVGGLTSGDTTAPDFDQAFVNYREDSTGATIDVAFTEDVASAFALDTSHWTATGRTVLTVDLLEPNHARVTLSAALATNGTLGTTGLPDTAANTSAAITVNPLE